jgi:glyoxylase-like metal-dependent hydrolase (beta-lactamase superfamily II)
MQITGQAQHEAWQQRTLPPVEEVRPDLWSIPVPIPNSPLRYVSAYALAVPGGIGLIDTGWESEHGWHALTAGLAGIGAAVTDVQGVLVTHLHFDHLGLRARATRLWRLGRDASRRRDCGPELERPRRGDCRGRPG